MAFEKGHIPWNTGLTKETDPRLARMGEISSQKLRGNRNAKGRPAWNKGLTKETDSRIKKYAEKLSKRIEIKCQQCGKIMRVKPCELNSKKFCSRACVYKSMEGIYPLSIGWSSGPHKRVQRKCLQCGKLFYVYPCILKRKGGGKYCSKKCYGRSISGKGNYWFGKKRNCHWLIERNMRVDIRKKISESRKGQPPWNRGLTKEIDHRVAKYAEIRRKLLHEKPEFLKRWLTHTKPNKSELYLLSILQRINPSWRYVGDGSLVISGKNPDFWNGDGGLIELFGDYWHEPGEEQKRVDFFKECGYDCLVIWEHELKDEEAVVSKVATFSA